MEMSANSVSVEALAERREVQTELELEETLVANPEMLEPGLRLIGRQTPSASGWLDLMGIDAASHGLGRFGRR